MKKVLEILKDNSNINNIGLVNYAKTVTEIHEHYMKFVDWVQYEYPCLDFIIPKDEEKYKYWSKPPEDKKGE